MIRTNTARRIALNIAASLFASALLTLGACSRSSGPDVQPAQRNSSAPAAEKEVIASSKSTAPSAAPAATEDTATVVPPQVSEIDDGSETVTDTPPVSTGAPGLKLAAAATPEPKAAPTAFKEGVNYRRLVPTQPTNVSPGQVEVVEVFWYACPHCFALDPKLEIWRQKNKPSYVVFQRIPATWNDATLFHGRVFYTAELLGKLEELHTPIFREIHLNGNTLNTMDKTKAFFTSHGVTAADFDKAFASFTLESKLQNATLLNKRYHVDSVPFFVVNGKYTADVVSAGGEEQLLQLLNELAAREHDDSP